MRIIQASIDHLDLLTPMFIRFREENGADTLPESSRKYLEERLTNQDSVIYLAFDDAEKTLYGFCQLFPSYSSSSLKRVWLINDIYVSQDARRQLVADRLLQKAKQMANETNSVRLRAMHQANNPNARAMYESIGFRDDKRFVTLTLEL